jgi:hypothetical protein
VLGVKPKGVARITVLGGAPDLAARFGFPPVQDGATARESPFAA